MRSSSAFLSLPICRAAFRAASRSTLAVGLLIAGTNAGGNVVANGDARTISIRHMHTGESLTITYKQNGMFDRDALEKLNWILRDWRRDEPTSMDPRLFDIVWEAHRQVGSNEPIQVVSAYRSPETNSMLRRRSKAVAKNSQHMLGKAMDFYLPDVSVSEIREIGLKMQRGGVGYYPNSYTPFVHLDAGSVRHWPRMTHDQLARLFPDGKTVHLPSDGRPLERYAEAEAEILANGGTVMGTSYASAEDETTTSSSGSGKSLWAMLFGGNNEDDDVNEAVAERPEPVRTVRKSVSVEAEEGEKPSKLVLKTAAQPIQSVAAIPLPSLAGYKLAAPGKAPLPPVRSGTQLTAQNPAPALPQKFADVPLPPTRPTAPQSQQIAMVAAAPPVPPKRTVFDGSETTGSLRTTGSALPKAISGSQNLSQSPASALAYAAPARTPAKTQKAPIAKSVAIAKAPAPKPVPTTLTMTTALHDDKLANGFTKTRSSLPQGKFAKLPLPGTAGFVDAN